MTYRLDAVHDRATITCLLCDRISELPGDVAHRYCGRCHLFHDSVADGRRLIAAGCTHECSEWRTFRGVCALCGLVVPLQAKAIAPGVYDTRDGALHIDIERMLKAHGYPDTPENRDTLARAAHDLARRLPDTKFEDA